MKKIGEFLIIDSISISSETFTSYGYGDRYPESKTIHRSVSFELTSTGPTNTDVFADESADNPIKVLLYMVPKGENSDDYELIKKNA